MSGCGRSREPGDGTAGPGRGPDLPAGGGRRPAAGRSGRSAGLAMSRESRPRGRRHRRRRRRRHPRLAGVAGRRRSVTSRPQLLRHRAPRAGTKRACKGPRLPNQTQPPNRADPGRDWRLTRSEITYGGSCFSAPDITRLKVQLNERRTNYQMQPWPSLWLYSDFSLV